MDTANRFSPRPRIALDGRKWYCVWDSAGNKWSTLLRFGKYATRRECQAAIDCTNNIQGEKV